MGYFIVFKAVQFTVKKEIKRKIKSNVNKEELHLIKLTQNSINKGENGFRFVKEGKEFILAGKMYDIVRRSKVNDTLYYYCINDTQEEALFANLDKQIKNNFESSPNTRDKTNHLIQNIIKEATPSIRVSFSSQSSNEISFQTYAENELINYFEVPTHPPEL